jgi:glycosyltransferase involved in cell wall biosynthesis
MVSLAPDATAQFLLWHSSPIPYHRYMNWVCQCAAVIPCFNEGKQIARVVADVRGYLPKVIVVDDGSTDDTAEKAHSAGAEVIRHQANCGKGVALQSGWKRAREQGFFWAMTLDGDGQHAPGDIPGFFDCAENSDSKLVVGNRLADAQGMPWVRRQVNRWMTRRLSELTGEALADSQCGFRLVHLETLAQLPIVTSRFEIESEMLAAFLAAGCPVRFVPVEVIYNSGGSKIHPVLDSWRWFRWWLAESWKIRAGHGFNSVSAPAIQCASRNTATHLPVPLPPDAPFPATPAGESRV